MTPRTPTQTSAPRLRSSLLDIPAYVPGKTAGRPAGGRRSYKLSSNENPHDPLPSVLDVVGREARSFNRYPDMAATDLVDALSGRYGLTPDHVAVGPGSVGVLTQLIAAVAGPGDEVVFAWRSFEAYPIVVRVGGATPVAVPLRPDWSHDLAAMAAAVTERTRCVLICTPNNPTGDSISHSELVGFLDSVPSDVLVVVDQAYVEFETDPDGVDGLALLAERGNVALLRTFSKAYGLAGLRVGYALAQPAVATALRKTAIPFAVSGLAQAAAVASFDAEAELMERVAAVVAERGRVSSELAAADWHVPRTQANFVWLPTGRQSRLFATACEVAGVSVRPFGDDGTRVSIGEPAANNLVLDVVRGWGGPEAPRS